MKLHTKKKGGLNSVTRFYSMLTQKITSMGKGGQKSLMRTWKEDAFHGKSICWKVLKGPSIIKI